VIRNSLTGFEGHLGTSPTGKSLSFVRRSIDLVHDER